MLYVVDSVAIVVRPSVAAHPARAMLETTVSYQAAVVSRAAQARVFIQAAVRTINLTASREYFPHFQWSCLFIVLKAR
jgi:hypothetical protein